MKWQDASATSRVFSSTCPITSLRADHAEAARVEQAHFHALVGQRHPRINIRRIIVVVNENVVAPAKIQPGGHKAQRERRRPDERDFFRLAVEQLRREFAPVVQSPGKNQRFLIVGRAALRAIGNGLCHAARQRADAGVRQKNFVARDGKFMPAQFFVGEQFSQRHASED